MSIKRTVSYKGGREPIIGDTCYGDAIGKLPTRYFVWLPCTKCGKLRWVGVLHSEPKNMLCRPCALKETVDGLRKHRSFTGDGYVTVKLSRDDFYYRMANKKGRVLEHRLIMAQSLNRCLLPWEIVHHRNGVKDDNRIDNLVLVLGQYKHVPDTELKRYAHRLEGRIQQLEDENDVLKYELNM